MNKKAFIIYLLCILCIRFWASGQPGGPGTVYRQTSVFSKVTTNPSRDFLGSSVDTRDGYISLYLNPVYSGQVTGVTYEALYHQKDRQTGPVRASVSGDPIRISGLSDNAYVLKELKLRDGRILKMDTTERIDVYSVAPSAQPRGDLQDFTRFMEGPNVATFITNFNHPNSRPQAGVLGGNTPLGCNDGYWTVVYTTRAPTTPQTSSIIVAENSCGERAVFGCIDPNLPSVLVGDRLLSNGGDPCDQSLILLPPRPTIQRYKCLAINPVITISGKCLPRDPQTGANGCVTLKASWTYYSSFWGSGTIPISELPYTYTWDNGLGTGDTKTVCNAGTYTVTLTIGACTYTKSVVIGRDSYAGRNVTDSVCADGQIIDLNARTPGKDGGGVWTRISGTGGVFDAAAGTFNPIGSRPPSVFRYRVAGVDGCSAATADLTINFSGYAGINGTRSVCSTSTAIILLANVITDAQRGGVWTRTSGTGGVFNAATGTFIPTGATHSTFTYTLPPVPPCTVGGTSTATVNVVPAAYAGDSGDTTVCDNATPLINLRGLLRNAHPVGTWTSLSGTGGTFNAAAGTFRPAGNRVTMVRKFLYTVQDSCGRDTAVVTIYIAPCCALDIRVTSTPISCTNSVSTMTATVASGGSGNYTYRWSGPNGFTATTATVTTSTAGTYTVTVTDVTGNCNAQASTTVTASSNMPVLVLSGNNPVCNNSPVTISASVFAGTGTAPFTYIFSNNAGTVLQSGPSNTFSIVPSGISSIIVKVVDASGCETIQSIPVNNPGPPLTLTNIISICAGQQTAVKADDGGIAGYTYLWLDDNSTNPVRTVGPLVTTRYTVVRTTPQGCKDTATSRVDVFAKPVILSIDSTQPACGINNGSITVHAAGDTSQLRYRLNSGSWQRSNVFTNLAAGIYTITVGNQNGTCQDTTTPPIVLREANNIISGIAGPSSICALENGFFIASPGVPGATYRWSATGSPQITGDSVSSTFTAQWGANQAGTTQSITMTVSLSGCTQTYTKPVVVTNAVFANGGPDKAICPSSEVSIGLPPNQAGPPGAVFSWSPSQYISGSSRTSSVLVKPLVTTDFILTVTDTINGCTRSDTVRIRVDVAVNPIADAGPDRRLPVSSTPDTVRFGGPTTTRPGMEPNTTIGYLWTALNGSPIGALSATNVSDPVFTRPAGVTTATVYTYVFMVQKQYTGASSLQGVTCPVFDTVQVRFTDLPVTVRLSPKVLLQGALYGNNPLVYVSDSIMRDNLRVQNKIPVTTPYPDLKNPVTGQNAFVPVNNAPETIGTGSPFPVSVILSDRGNDAIVDWVFLELRSASDPQKVVATRSALVQRDGDVVDIDGFSPVTFDNLTDLNCHLVVRHRNHLGVMTQAPLQLSTTTQVVDFTHSPADGGVVTYGNNSQKVLPGGHLALWAGNVNADRFIIFNGANNDQNALQHIIYNVPANTTQNLSYIYNAYTQADVDMKGTGIYQGAGNDANYISENVYNHPANPNHNQTYIMFEQVPPRNN